MSVREQLRRKQQIRARQIVPSMLRADWRVLNACSDAVQRGDTDAEVAPPLFDAYEEVLGRMVDHGEDGYPLVINSRFVDPSESRTHLCCKGRRLYRGAA